MKKCTCQLKKGTQACRNCSRFKLVFLLKREHKNQERNANPVWYSILKEEKKPINELFFSYMLPRAKKSPWYFNCNVIQFWERGMSQPTFTYTP